MAVESLSSVLRRRWYVVLGGALITLLAGAVVVQSTGVHYHRAEVAFGAPGTRSLIPFAAAVGWSAGQHQGFTFPSTRAELHAAGVRSGTWIRLADTGGQWSRVNASATLVVEAVDPDPARAERLLDEALQRVEGATDTLQADGSVPTAARIVPRIQYQESYFVGATRFEAARAIVVWLALAALFTVLAARAVDEVLEGGRHRNRPGRA